MLPHLIMVAKVVYPHMFLHVGMIKILPEPAHITPVEVPLSFTIREIADQDSSHKYDREDDVMMNRKHYSLFDFNPTWSLAQDILYGVE